MRRAGRSFATLVMLAISVALSVSAIAAFLSLYEGITQASQRLGADIVVLPADVGVSAQEMLFTAEPANIYLPANAQAAVAGVKGVEATTPQFFTQTLNQSCCSILGVTRVVGIDAASDFVISSWLEGDSDGSLGPDEIILGSAAPEVVGNTVSILNKKFVVKGRLASTGTSVDETVFMDIETARTIGWESPYLQGVWQKADPFTSISAVMVKVAPGHDPDTVAEAITAAYPYASVTAVSSLVKNTSQQLSLSSNLFGVLVAAVLVLTVLALIGRFSAVAAERRKEIGFMRAIGFTRGEVAGALLLEAGMIALGAGALGSVLGILAASSLVDNLHAVFALPGTGLSAFVVVCAIVLGVAGSVALGILSSLGTALRHARMDPYAAMRKGEL